MENIFAEAAGALNYDYYYRRTEESPGADVALICFFEFLILRGWPPNQSDPRSMHKLSTGQAFPAAAMRLCNVKCIGQVAAYLQKYHLQKQHEVYVRENKR